MGGSDTGYLLECCGCEALYFRRDLTFSQWDPGEVDISYWPAPVARKRPEWLEEVEVADRVLGRLLKELYQALDANLRVVSATAIRTALDRTSEILGVNAAKPFEHKLNDLVKGGNIGETERDIFKVLIDAGSAAAHRGWTPKPGELSTMMDILEAFLHRSFIVGEGVKRLKAAVPVKAGPKPAPTS